ncbi:MAG TPA: tyrosine-protein phosphatase, partial [Pyrinomonadaceae bacterium]|nr:tyrosine-protein phosphatase [Pyrinomonadaceae bacterium]
TPESEPRYQELPNFHRVNTKVYRGGQPRQGGIQKLATLGVKTVINLRDDDERAKAEGREAGTAGLRYFNIPLGRLGRPQDAEVERVLSLINDLQNGVIFVHCAHGADRTGVVMAIYRIAHDGWTSEQAKQEADRYGMKFWQHGMKDYVHDYYRNRALHANPMQPERRRKISSTLLTPTPSFPRHNA